MQLVLLGEPVLVVVSAPGGEGVTWGQRHRREAWEFREARRTLP